MQIQKLLKILYYILRKGENYIIFTVRIFSFWGEK